MIKDYLIFALKSLSNRRLRSWLTMIGIFIGIAAVVSLIGLGEGLRIAVTSQFGFLGSDILSIQASGLNYAGPPGSGVTNRLKDTLVDKISKVNGVDIAINRYIKVTKVEFNRNQVIGYVTSVPGGDKRKTAEKMSNLQVQFGRALKDGDGRKVVVGNDFSKDKMFLKPVNIGDRILINSTLYEVVGILKKRGSFLVDGAIFMNEDQLLNDFGKDGTVDAIAVKVKPDADINAVKESIENLMRKERKVKIGEEDFEVQTPQKILATLNSTLFAVQLFVYIIASVSLIVGGIGITNTMYTSVLERTREIGIMKSIGAKNSTIFLLFAIESGLLGMVGGLIGITLGTSLAYGFAYVGSVALGSELIQANISILLVIGALIFSFVLGLAAGIVPAYQASKMPPVDALRFAK